MNLMTVGILTRVNARTDLRATIANSVRTKSLINPRAILDIFRFRNVVACKIMTIESAYIPTK